MTSTDALAATGRVYLRARAWQARFEGHARLAESVGCTREAGALRAIGARALIVADRYVERLQERIGDESHRTQAEAAKALRLTPQQQKIQGGLFPDNAFVWPEEGKS